MQILGFNKTTLLDFPEHVASTIFTGGCNFRCPFCQNGDLVLNPNSIESYDENEIIKYLDKHKNMLDGVCITGGEPTLQRDLPDFLARVKALNLLVKLDTNGYNPSILRELMERHLVDMVAMDIKNCKEKYAMTTGVADLDIDKIDESVKMLIAGDTPFEFRTTVVKELHNAEDFKIIGEWIKGAPKYFLQCYRESDRVISPGFSAYGKEELEAFKALLSEYIPCVELRGLD
ncbi:MAG: anaerobic ribonucleoside-triphosphate reductase activating protein [Lachnospiraceae bacterium]|nr:anaerobic ribonucleoside-triphosphate reductase activating protein [Lachnospiraceae bacterium]